jgi:hypothetical protein
MFKKKNLRSKAFGLKGEALVRFHLLAVSLLVLATDPQSVLTSNELKGN